VYPDEYEWFPCTEEFFYKSTNKKDGLHPECKECCKKKFRQYSKDFRDELQITRKIRDEKDKDHYIGYQREYFQTHKEQELEKQRKYQKNHPDKIKIHSEKRSVKNHKISTKEWIACKDYFKNEQDEWCCAYCALPASQHFYTRKGVTKLGDFHKEHKDDEGANDLSNCLPSCRSCNSKKWKHLFEKWYTPNNPIFNQERLDKINKWLKEDYKLYIKDK
jgi:hypothetical protein